jgi:hypothetical protein
MACQLSANAAENAAQAAVGTEFVNKKDGIHWESWTLRLFF